MAARLTPEEVLGTLGWPRRLTLAGLWAERLGQCFWPLWVIALLTFAAFSFGAEELLPLGWRGPALIALGLLALAALLRGLRRFRRPTAEEALRRLDASLPGQPIATLRDRQAIGAGDPASAAVWQIHLSRMAERAKAARPVPPDLNLAPHDPFSLRYVALTAAVMALLFGSVWRMGEATGITPGTATAMPAGAVWEGWAKPPAYTGKPVIYLNDAPEGDLTLPVGSRIQIRIYGPQESLTITQDIGPPQESPAPGDAAALTRPPDTGLHEIIVGTSGKLAIEGHGGRRWNILALPDAGPQVELTGEIGRDGKGRFKQPYKASDDYGITGGQVTLSLDLASVPRQHGLVLEPEPIPPVELDLALPIKGRRDRIEAVFTDDLSKSILSNMPVSMRFTVKDAIGQTGTAGPRSVILPGKRFFDPAANAVIEMRRDLLWNRANAERASEILKAIIHRPEELGRSEEAVKRLRVLIRGMDASLASGPLSDARRDEIAEELWQIALTFEEGPLGSARERLERAQDRLEEAIRNGASPEEIDQLMKEMQQAMRDYTRELGEEAQRNPQSGGGEGEGMKITGDQLQQMLDEIQRMMEEGRTAEAMAMMEQLRQLMENLQVRQGEGGEGGSGGQGNQGMRELGNTLKDQQGLADDAYRDMQRGYNGEEPGDSSELADRQRALRDRLRDLQNQKLPGDGSEKGEQGREELRRAEEAMRRAEEALENGDLGEALDNQAEAMEAMREGTRNFNQALAEQQRDGRGERADDAGRNLNRVDPLGRDRDNAARIGSDRNMVQNSPDKRAQELLDEIRRRSGEATRPKVELDYLKRLLELF